MFMVLAAMLFIFSGNAQENFEKAVQKIREKPEYKNATIGIDILNLATGEKVFGLNEHQLMIPASTIKLVTSAAAMEILGADYRFRTVIGYTGKIRNTKLTGDLIVVGGGDPALGSEYFRDQYFNPHFMDVWAQNIKAAGIQLVDGDIFLDPSIYNDEEIPDTWIWGDIGNYYGAGPSAFTIYDNLYRISFKSPKQPGKQTTITAINPKMEDLNISNEVISSDINKDQAYVYGSPLDKSREIRGTIPKNRKSFTIKGSVLQPEELFASELLTHLAKNGVFVTGNIVFHPVNRNKMKMVYVQESPTLESIAEVLNHESVNLFAEHLLKQISAEIQGEGRRDSSIAIVQRFWKDKIPDHFFMEDGSGLSHFNAISPADFTAILKYMYNTSKNRQAFLTSLPTAGEGTLSGFSTKLFPKEILQAKSGSMTRVRCYAGYLKTDNGKRLAFNIMFNNFGYSHSALVNEIENLLLVLKSTF